MIKEISLGNASYFDIFIGKRILKADVFQSLGDIPAYSANVFNPFGNVAKSNINNFSYDYVLWGIDGKFEFNIIRKGSLFATTDHCGAVAIKDKNILPEYLLYELELQGHIKGFDRTLRSSLSNMKDIFVRIPIDCHGSFDKKVQVEIVKKYMSIKKIKETLKSEANEIEGITLEIPLPQTVIELSIEALFDLNQGTNSSLFTKAFVNKHPGDIPVFSASKNTDDISYGYVRDNLPGIKYFDDILTWNIDGSVGKAFFREGRFSLSEKVIPLILKDKWTGLIDYKYVKYVLERKAVERGFAFSNKAGKTRIKDIKIEIPAYKDNSCLIPNLKKQKELAEEYAEIYATKNKLVEYLQGLNEITVEI